MIVKRHYGIEPLTHFSRADQLLLRHDADALDPHTTCMLMPCSRTRRVVVTQLP